MLDHPPVFAAQPFLPEPVALRTGGVSDPLPPRDVALCGREQGRPPAIFRGPGNGSSLPHQGWCISATDCSVRRCCCPVTACTHERGALGAHGCEEGPWAGLRPAWWLGWQPRWLAAPGAFCCGGRVKWGSFCRGPGVARRHPRERTVGCHVESGIPTVSHWVSALNTECPHSKCECPGVRMTSHPGAPVPCRLHAAEWSFEDRGMEEVRSKTSQARKLLGISQSRRPAARKDG